jgi:preprotein translocase subunit SecD
MTRRLWLSLIATLVIVYGVLLTNLVRGNAPILGLDLQGGVSMILAPEGEDAATSELEITRDLVRDELERSGVAEPDVRVQGANIVVDLPGIDNPDEVLDRVRVSGVVELRPVVPFEQCSATSPDFSVSDLGDLETNPDAEPEPAAPTSVRSASAGVRPR